MRTFLDTEQAVLLGARAFWQGVDIPGDACQAVVIEKLPFDVPGDPLIQRRGELIERDGGNSFMDFMLPRMLLRLNNRHRGGISVDSAPGEGSIFSVWLPVAEGAAGEVEAIPDRNKTVMETS